MSSIVIKTSEFLVHSKPGLCNAVLQQAIWLRGVSQFLRHHMLGILPDIQDAFAITNSQAGLLQTVFVLVYMVVAPIYGYLGDRFNRRYLMSFGVFFWSLTTLVGSFMPNYASFTVFRCLVGVGEASYSTIAPTIISDMFVQDQRSKMLAFFYFAIPVGSGLGYMVGAEVTHIAKSLGADDLFAWRWGLRVTPIMGFIAVLLILFVMQEPPRGEVEGGEHLRPTHFLGDLKDLATNKSYVFSTIAFTCVTFVAGALAWWGPLFVEAGVEVQEHPDVNVNGVAFVFGVIAMIAGLVGVPLGSFGGQYLRKILPFGDPLVCGLGIILCIPLLMSGMYMAEYDTRAAYAIVFFGQVFLNLNWAVISDIVLYVVIPTRRSSAEAFQILFSHAFGDAGSPYVVGMVADWLKPYYLKNQSDVMTTETSPLAKHLLFLSANISATATPDADDKYASFKALQVSLYLTTSVLFLGAVFFFISCCFIEKDKERTDRAITGGDAHSHAGSEHCSTDSSSDGDPASSVHPRHRYAHEAPPPELDQTSALLV
ncbi:Major facilitator superfamily [Trinorchestia longiramus]|nr:Major facilitator superfamily [Trinorchestia longiramus]